MDLELNIVEYGLVGTTLPKTMKLLPPIERKQQQKVVVGDLDGYLQVFSIKKNAVEVQFKTNPIEKITAVHIGSPTTGTGGDKIFVASENIVRGFNKKGKMFLTFDTNLTEPIKSMFVSGSDLIICGNHVFNHYRDCKDIGSYLCGDTIVDVVALCPNNTNRIIAVLACSGRVLRLIEHSRVRQSIELDSVPTVLHVPKGLGNRLICGFADGKVILYHIEPFSTEVKEETLVPINLENTSAIASLDTCDITGDGTDDLLIGRRDGTVQIYSLPSVEDTFVVQTEPRQLYTGNFTESISSIQGGCVGAAGYSEVIICTYAGRILGLTTKCLNISLSDTTLSQQKTNGTFDRMGKVFTKRGSESKMRNSFSENSFDNDQDMIQMANILGNTNLQTCDFIESFELSKENSCYKLSIEVALPILQVELQSDVPLELLDVKEMNPSAEVTTAAPQPIVGIHFLGKLNFIDECKRINVLMKTLEGHSGIIQAYVTLNKSNEIPLLREFTIKPLSLHMRIHRFDEERPCHMLSLKGSFSHAEMHNWILNCIPEVPEKLEAVGVGEQSSYNFKNVFVGTILKCEYGKGLVTFKSDNITTISILKDFLTKQATKKRIQLEMQTDINDASMAYMLKLIEHDLVYSLKMSHDYKWLVPLMDLGLRNEEERNCLCDRYLDILNRQDEILRAQKLASDKIGRLTGLLTDCYIDRFKFRAVNVKEKVPQLIKLINRFDYDKIVRFFEGKLSDDEIEEDTVVEGS